MRAITVLVDQRLYRFRSAVRCGRTIILALLYIGMGSTIFPVEGVHYMIGSFLAKRNYYRRDQRVGDLFAFYLTGKYARVSRYPSDRSTCARSFQLLFMRLFRARRDVLPSHDSLDGVPGKYYHFRARRFLKLNLQQYRTCVTSFSSS